LKKKEETMNLKKSSSLVLLAACALWLTPRMSSATPLFHSATMDLNMHAYLQALGEIENVPDKVRDSNRVYLFLKEARLQFDGDINGVKFDVMLAPGGEDATPNTNAALGLLDFSFDVPLRKETDLKIGQFLVPYGRERLTADSTIDFGDRSITNLGFAWNRDYGFALSHKAGNLMGSVALLSGGGRDIPQRYLPEKLGVPMVAARFGYDDGVDKDIYHVSAKDLAPDRAKHAFFLNGLYLEDSSIGHSTVVNVRATDKNLLVNSNYNPFIGRAPFSLATIYQFGGDAAYRAPWNGGAVSAEAQVDFSHFDNKYGSLSLKGARVQAGIDRGRFGVNVRLAALWLDRKMALTNGATLLPVLPDDKPLKEITPSLVYRWRDGVKAVADFSYLPDMLVFQENTIGSYVMSEQPDQVTVIKPGTTAGTGGRVRKDVFIGRLMLQLGF
jgi:hypothetical protein